jgi:UDP-N-acetylglucosamine--N-acetylmuramyl-(pentapeptide) pyrophosphoryl-undecaprenol N-acetylglucosamine transferase
MLAATQLGLPTAIHEQNAVLGRANRLLAPRVRRIATGFAETAGLGDGGPGRIVHTGNPVRSAILAVGKTGYRPPEGDGPVELLVLGGSQGARIFAEIVPPALASLPAELRKRLRLSLQARPEDRAEAAAALADADIAADVESFFTDIPQRLARAHLVICRAGASTIAELAAIGRPALLIPYPHAMDDHQTANARAFAEAGGGWVMSQAELRPDTLALYLENLLNDPPALAAAAQSAREFGRREAAQQLAHLAVELGLGSRAQGRAA